MYIDQQSDTGKKALYKLMGAINDPGLKTTLKTTNFDPKSISEVDAKAFALPSKRQFPVNTPENTVLSKVYYDAQRPTMATADAESIGKVLDVHLGLHSIPEDTFQYKTAAEGTPEKTIESVCLLPEHNFCKVASVTDLSQASILFDAGHSNLQLSDRVEFASNFIKAAEALDAKVDSAEILKYAGMLDYDPVHTQCALELRSGMASRKGGDSSAFYKLAAALENLTEVPTVEELRKLADTIVDMDQAAGITETDYHGGIESPYGVVFSKQSNEASEVTEGESNSAQQLTKADIIGKYGDDVLEQVELADGSIDYAALDNVIKSTIGIGGAKK